VSVLVFAVVLASAVLHASWNALAKAIPDRLVAAALIGLGYLVGGVAGLVAFGLPAARSLPYAVGSALLQVCYLLLLTAAYRHGEFARVYPLARGLSPLLVTVVTVTVLGAHLSPGELAGIALIVGALGALVLVGGRPRRGDGLGLAAATGVVIALYTLVDGFGVRGSGDALGYASLLFALQGPVLPVVCRLLSGPGFTARLVRHAPLGLLGGLLSLLSYGAVVWAQSLGSLALVSALRETSVLFAGAIGALFFAERFSRLRMAVTAVAVGGIVLLQLSQ
jgi:drug/metabolite transporter (DMT)-like permease